MINPSEHDYIDKCKHLIECRLEWANSSTWKNRDFEYLSELIFEKSKIAISVSTLKRIWQNHPSRIPHVSTLNALSQFLDYGNWNEFKTKLKNDIGASRVTEKPIYQKKKGGFMFVVIAILCLIIFSILFLSLKNRINKKRYAYFSIPEKEVVFTSKKTVTSGLPNTVVFNYDLSKIKFDSAFIQQDWDKTKRKKIFPENRFHTCIYYYPGYYTAKLVINDQVVKKFPLFVTTNGWMAVYKKKYSQDVPIYLNNIDPIKNHCLHVTVEDLETNKINNDKDYIIGFYNTRDFGDVHCDSFSFETEIKNDPKEGGLTCGYTAITVQGEKGYLTASFSEKGCTAQLFLEFSDIYMDGTKNDLSSFGADLTRLRNIKYNVLNKNVAISIDNKEIKKFTFKRDIGKIIGFSYQFYGCGTVKMVKLSDKNANIVYLENFK
jgi:hypothetical protein